MTEKTIEECKHEWTRAFCIKCKVLDYSDNYEAGKAEGIAIGQKDMIAKIRKFRKTHKCYTHSCCVNALEERLDSLKQKEVDG